MRRLTPELLVVVLLAATAAASAQGPPPPAGTPPKETLVEKLTLEQLLELAIKNNPDVRVAEAKLREAEAELNRTKLAVVQKVIAFQTGREVARKAVADAEEHFKRVEKLAAAGTAPVGQAMAAATALAQAKGELAKLEAEAPYLLGQVHGFNLGPAAKADWKWTVESVTLADRPRPAADPPGRATPLPRAEADKLRKALATPVKVELKNVAFDDILRYLEETVPGLTFRNPLRDRFKWANPSLTLKAREQLPVRAVLQLIEDEFPAPPPEGGVRFVVREYGILVAPADAVPPGSLLVQDFVRGQPEAAGKNPPEAVEGVVKRVDGANGLVTISIGSDAGLEKGHTLEVYRLKPQPRYLGTLTVIEVQPTEAVGRVRGVKEANIQAGDQVTSRLLGQ